MKKGLKTEAAKHTPGPWEWRGESSTQVIAWNDDHSERGVVAQVGTDGGTFSKSEAQANARLIAASPDLLAALRAVLDHGQRLDPHHEDLCNVCGPTRAAIAKVEGK